MSGKSQRAEGEVPEASHLYLSARWPGGAYLFGRRFRDLLGAGAVSPVLVQFRRRSLVPGPPSMDGGDSRSYRPDEQQGDG
jgi:hypothetical protein